MNMFISTQSWLFLFIAIFFGVLGTISMKLSDGLQKRKPSICLLIFYGISFFMLTLALQGMDMSIVYAIWSGVGTMLVAVIGMILFKESFSALKLASLCLIVIGVFGIHLTNVFP